MSAESASERALLANLDLVIQQCEAEESLAAYARYTLEVVPAAHHELICDAIDRLLNDEFDELIINSPPGSAKSTYTSHALPGYYIGKHPNRNIILATHTAELSQHWSRRVRNTVAAPEHAIIFPNSELSRDSQAVTRWATTRGGQLLAAGVGGSILGFRADLGVIDDPISGFEQAQSEEQLLKVQQWYETDFVTRLKPNAKVVLICQRLSANDLAGYLIARNQISQTRRQLILILRMEAEDDDPLGRQPGERLWPEWYTQEMVEDAKRHEFNWLTLYQQRPPSGDGSWVSDDELVTVDDVPYLERLRCYVLSDLALSVNSGDFSVHIAVGVASNGDIYVLEAWRGRVSIDETCEKHLQFCKTYLPIESLIDDDNAAKVYAQLLITAAKQAGTFVPIKMLPMRGQNKETRAAPLRGLFKMRRIVFVRGIWNQWLFKELKTFPNAIGSGVDDGIDALGLIGRRLAVLARPSEVKKPEPQIFKLPTLNELWSDRESNSIEQRARI